MLPTSPNAVPQIDIQTDLALSADQRAVLAALFAPYQRLVILAQFGGGLSGSTVLLVRALRSDNSPDLPAVVKIALRGLIEQEWDAYTHHVHNRLPGIAALSGPPAFPSNTPLGGLRYALAGEGGIFEVESLYTYYQHAGTQVIVEILEKRLFPIVGKNWWLVRHAQPDWPVRAGYDFLLPVNLLLAYEALPADRPTDTLSPTQLPLAPLSIGDTLLLRDFVVTEIEPKEGVVTLNLPPRQDGLPAAYRLRVRGVPLDNRFQVGQPIPPLSGRVVATRSSQLRDQARQALAGLDLTQPVLTAPDGLRLSNPLPAVPKLLKQTRTVMVATIHGDLNLENILVEPGQGNISLIDFATARRDHAIHDFLRLETEIVTKLLPPVLAGNRLAVRELNYFYQCLADALAPQPPADPAADLPPGLQKPFRVILTIRRMAQQLLHTMHDWTEYNEGLILYLLGALKFKNLDRLPQQPLPKQLAFWAAAILYTQQVPATWAGEPARNWSRLQPFLPADLYQERDEEKSRAHLTEVLRAVVTYLPRHLALELLHTPYQPPVRGRFLNGTLLLADISGFTAMSEQLRKLGAKEGAEKMTDLINRFLEVMLDILYRHDGRLIKFGGDAMLCLFSGSDQGAPQAIRAAWAMQQATREEFQAVEIYQQVFPLGLKAGGHSGQLFAADIGHGDHREYFLTGSAVEQTAKAEAAAQGNAIMISHETYQLVRTDLTVAPIPTPPAFYRVVDLAPWDRAAESDPWAEIEDYLTAFSRNLWELVPRLEGIAPYLPAGVLPHLVYDPQQGQIDGQHRRATVMFVNFTGSSEIIQARGDKDEAGIAADLARYYDAMQEEVQYYGGMIDKVDLYNQGDKLMVIFGAPVAHERDAQRAALAALAMQQALANLVQDAEGNPKDHLPSKFSQRIGIHTGFVFAGNVGAKGQQRREYTVMGDTVNLAARLMSEARFGQTWISRETWDQLAGRFEAEEGPPFRPKGLDRDITARVLRAIRSRADDTKWVRPYQAAQFVGRLEELDHLIVPFIQTVGGGHKGVEAIIGEAGVGKTRLVHEWQTLIEQPDIQAQLNGRNPFWICAQGQSYGQQPYGIFVEVVEQLLGFDDADDPQTRWQKLGRRLDRIHGGPNAASAWLETYKNHLAYLEQFLSFELSPEDSLAERIAGLDAEARYAGIRAAVIALLRAAAAESPLVLILEDLHWADPGSLDLLQFVLRQTDVTAPILFCLIFRPLKEKPIWLAWRAIAGEYFNGHPPIELKELSQDDGRQLVANLLDIDPIPDDLEPLLNLILDTTDGNPLYIEEVLHLLINQDQVLTRNNGQWQLRQPVQTIRIPDTLYQIIQSRIDELDFLSPGARRALWMAAVISQQFNLKLWSHLFANTRPERERLEPHEKALSRADLIERIRNRAEIDPAYLTEINYRFRHGLVRQAAYENASLAQRRRYHQLAGQWLEGRHQADLARQFQTLAHHFDRGEVWDKAFHYRFEAGKQAARSFDNPDAINHFRAALEIPNRAPKDDFQADETALARTHAALGQVLYTSAEFREAITHLDEAYRRFGTLPGDDLNRARARTCYYLGRSFEHLGGGENADLALTWQQRGLNLLPEEPTAEAALLHILGSMVKVRQADLADAAAEATEVLTIARQVGETARAEQSVAHRLLSAVERARGNLAQAMDHCLEGIAISKELDDRLGLATGYSNEGVFAMEMDNWQQAGEAYRQGLQRLEELGDRYQLAMTCCNLADLACHQGDLPEALPLAGRGLTLFQAVQSTQGQIFALAVLATIYWRQNALEQAHEVLDEARDLITTHGEGEFEATVGRWLAQVYLSQGEVERAEAEIEPLLGLGEDLLADEREPLQHLHARVLAAQGQTDEAVQVLQASLARLGDKGMRYQAGQAHLTMAQVLAAAGSQTDEIRDHADAARDIFAALGARLDLQAVEALLNGS